MITIVFNGEPHSFEHSLLSEVLTEITDINIQCCAIALNQHFIPRSEYANTVLKKNDQLELLTPMQGG